ncbi:MAG: hypothetical protein M3Z85_06600, partial [Acidobacteriota bacterium]|nr:hypothetical protein [Acidobacteriota bacterium]
VLSSVVTNTSESGVGGLRAALHYAVDHPGTTITFNIPNTDPGYGNGVFTIRLTGHLLPLVVDGTIIDATTQPGYTSSPLIVLDGSQILPEAGAVPAIVPGMHMFAANCSVRGISIQSFPWVGLAFLYADSNNNTVRACRLGLNNAGTGAAPNYQGIYISDGANSNTIGGANAADRNVISGNTQYGVWISSPNSTGNVVLGNYIGTTADGSAALANAFGGVIVTDGSHNNTIGGTSAAARNIISGNTNAGIWITGSGVNQNTVRNNYIGLAANGNAAVPNSFGGLYLFNGTQNNLIADNVISGNASEGIRLADVGTSNNVVQGNRLGLAPTGNGIFPNGFGGITILSGATGNTIGGTNASQRNILSGNGTVGLVFSGAGASGNIAIGNYIGTDATGTASVANGFAGVYITAGATANQLGGVQGGSGNLISGNNGYGVFIADNGTNGNLVRGNFIGTNAGGTAALPNAYAGVNIHGGAQNNLIGDGTIGASNLIADNSGEGVILFDATTIKNKITRNSISSNGDRGIVLVPDANAGNMKPNNAEPFPSLSSAALSTATNQDGTDVSGTFTGSGGTIEFFASATGDPSGFGQGQYFIGSIPAASSFTAHLVAVVPANYAVAATATDSNGNTSEFSGTTIVPAPIDSVGGGVPDNWKLAHFGPNWQTDPNSGANIDADGDGLTNLQEFKAGTDPKSTTSRFFVSAIARSGNDRVLTFASVAGKTYQIQYKDDLLNTTWLLLKDQIFASTASTQITDSGASSLSHRFYRVAIEP